MIRLAPIFLAIAYAIVHYQIAMRRGLRELDDQSTELIDPRLNQLTDQMAAALGVARVPVFIHEVDPVNGLAAADGRIFITRGLYNKMRAGDLTGPEVASVIAHELGHVALGHSKRRMADFAGQNALRTALMMIIGRFIPFVGPLIANSVASLLSSKLSRNDEYEADAYAAALLTKSGIGIAPQISMFEKLDDLTNSRRGVLPAWLLSHPNTSDRISALKQLQAKWS